MRNTTKRAYVLFALIAVFFIGFAILAVRFGMNGEKWATDVHNELLATTRVPSLYDKSTITDRNGKMLFESDKDKGHNWSADPTIRKATLHVVGDAGNIGSSILKQSKEIILEPTYTYDLVNGLQVTKVQEGDDVDRDIQLTIDADVCKTAYQAVISYSAGANRGTIMAYNYKTGEVYCLTSLPSYDPKNPPKEPESGTYYNKALSSTFTPGSTFKIVTSICALENGKADYRFNCNGVVKVGGRDIECYDKTKHGNLTIQTGLNQSCNGIFSQLAVELGKEKIAKTVNQLGFTSTVYINGVQTGKNKFEIDEASVHEVGKIGMGQYRTEVTPCQMLMLMGAIANNGKAVIPTLIMDDPTNGQINENIHLNADTAATMKTFLRSNFTDYYESHSSAARDSVIKSLELCGKTGTAEHIDKEGNANDKNHAWFVGFSQREDFPVAIVVCLEDMPATAASGIGNAIPAACEVLKAIWNAHIVQP
ncbi:MAG: hypothetical protein IJL52_01360 [Clostridia bacterium]|nr:hypothetical protein [Clostridia bacterium]